MSLTAKTKSQSESQFASKLNVQNKLVQGRRKISHSV